MWVHGPWKCSSYWPSTLRSSYSGSRNVGEPVDEVGREHLGLAVERVTGEPDQLLLGEADGAGMVELGAQFALVDDLGEPHMPAAVDDRKGDLLVRIEFPDHLQHQQLVEIGIEQAAHDRIEPPAVIVGSGCNVGDCHGGTLPRREPPQPVAFWPGMAAQRAIPAGPGRPPPGHRSRPACPGRIAAEIGDQFGDLAVGQAVLEGRHIAEVARRPAWRCRAG